MEIHQLEYVLAVARYRHFSNAADEICISQSTLSQQIGKLEEELGVPLFKRTTRTVTLTPAGEEFVKYATNILKELTQAKRAMQNHVSAERGRVVIGAIPVWGILGFTALIAAFQRSYPNVQVELKEDASERLLELLDDSQIDVAILGPPQNIEQYKNIHFYPIIKDELVLVTNWSHPLAKKKIIHLSDTKNENYIFLKPSSTLLKLSLEACGQAGFVPNIIYQSSQWNVIIALVAEGMGITLLSRQVAKALKTTPPVSIIKIHNAPKRVIALATSDHAQFSPAVSAFYTFTTQSRLVNTKG